MNFLDLLLLLMFLGAIVAGFFQGMIRILVLVGSFYLSLVLASLYFPVMAGVFVTRFGAERYVGEYVGFALILVFGFIFLSIAGLYTFRYARLPASLLYLDRSLGLFLGMFLGVLFVGMFAVLLWNLMIVRGGQSLEYPIMRWLGRQVATSSLLVFSSNELLPLVYRVANPILPDAADIIFQVR